MGWKEVEKELPPPKIRVELSYGLFGTRAAVCDDWISEGWVLESGSWSVVWKEGMPKFPKPTHWRLKNE